MPDCIVIGGGVIGMMTARELTLKGIRGYTIRKRLLVAKSLLGLAEALLVHCTPGNIPMRSIIFHLHHKRYMKVYVMSCWIQLELTQSFTDAVF